MPEHPAAIGAGRGEAGLPSGYPELLKDLKRTVAAARWQAQRIVNTELLELYWHIRDAVLRRQRAAGWGARVIDRLPTVRPAGDSLPAAPHEGQPVRLSRPSAQ